MTNFVKMEKISLKNNPNIKEDLIQNFIFNDPSILGLGELSPIMREKIQPVGGRLDLLLGDDDGSRYEIEVQLGATDPSHIIRTIEYWDTERKRYPQYDHCAVIIAEEITGRFMNVISLFNGTIPLIALQVSAYKMGNEIALTFTKIIDRISLGTDEEEQYEVRDRNYWEKQSSSKILKIVDAIFNDTKEYTDGYELKYNKYYIGLSKDGIANNFISFKPLKNFLYFVFIRIEEDKEKFQALEDAGLEYSYTPKWRKLKIRISNYEEYKEHKELLNTFVKVAMENYRL